MKIISTPWKFIRSATVQFSLAAAFILLLHSEDPAPAWFKEWKNDTIHLKIEQYFWIPEGAKVDNEIIEDIRNHSKLCQSIVLEYSFQEFSFGGIKWVSVVNKVATTDPVYMLKENGTWKIVLDRFRNKIPYPNLKVKTLMENMFDSLETQNKIYIKGM